MVSHYTIPIHLLGSGTVTIYPTRGTVLRPSLRVPACISHTCHRPFLPITLTIPSCPNSAYNPAILRRTTRLSLLST